VELTKKCFRARITVRWMMVMVVVVALLSMKMSSEARRRWNACQTAANRQTELADMHAAFALSHAKVAKKPKADAAMLTREKETAALHREMSRRNWWAFFDPFRECMLDRDLY
jgi:hypothetical protein